VFETKKFAERPRLEWAAARSVRCFGIENFRNMVEAGFIQMFVKGWKESVASLLDRRLRTSAHSYPSFDKRAY
jgi:hypothetical protein